MHVMQLLDLNTHDPMHMQSASVNTYVTSMIDQLKWQKLEHYRDNSRSHFNKFTQQHQFYASVNGNAALAPILLK